MALSADAIALSADAIALSVDTIPLSVDAIPLSVDAIALLVETIPLSADTIDFFRYVFLRQGSFRSVRHRYLQNAIAKFIGDDRNLTHNPLGVFGRLLIYIQYDLRIYKKYHPCPLSNNSLFNIQQRLKNEYKIFKAVFYDKYLGSNDS